MTATETILATTDGGAGSATATALPSSPGGSFGRLLRFAFANIRRRPERFILAALGIALAIMAVTVVRTISTSFAFTGADAVSRAVNGSHLWVVPPAGVVYDSEAGALVAKGAPASFEVPQGYTAHPTIAGIWKSPEGHVAVYGSESVADGTASVGSDLADRLDLKSGDSLDVDGHALIVDVKGDGPILTTSDAMAQAVVGDVGWTTVSESAADSGRLDLGPFFQSASGITTTTDPTVEPSGGKPLAYATVGGQGVLDFNQKYAAIFSGQVTSSTLGLISIIGLILGFVIAVSSFLASVQERRREFGIMSSIGLADEVLYFFLVESGIVFLFSWVLGISAAGVAVWLVIPSIATPMAWLQAAGMVLGFVPAMAIVGALVPVHRLLQQRPVHLLSD
ncbi:ABC transporter permease [Nocardioides sp. Kera G14]|uniref:ABC transporter permease n=1 Tax=Nocardioides sp. Kera G14 TaxID=2884264 RepID=UPI001D125503|nr:ABC transporter permease [Nocardioides sp. Kera G14]UDY24801.1 ABC transporter permease [Nocardioides sp. Kera G14]